MSTIHHVFGKTDWNLLALQKLALLETMAALDEVGVSKTVEHLTGLLHWIDAVQDAAEADGFPVVFLSDDC